MGVVTAQVTGSPNFVMAASTLVLRIGSEVGMAVVGRIRVERERTDRMMKRDENCIVDCSD